MHEVNSKQPIGQGFSQVADDDRQIGKAVKNAAHDDSQQVQTGLDGKAEDCSVQAAFEKRPDHAGGRSSGMQIDRDMQGLRRFEDGPKL